MADNTPDTDPPQGEEAPQTQTESKTQILSQFLRGNWTAKLLALLILVHISGYVYYGYWRSNAKTSKIYEINLGSYQFTGDGAGEDRVANARFRLFVSLLSEVDQSGHTLMKAHKYKVQQDIEELLRQAHARDFEDPSLTELKRQIQETVNQTVGKRIVQHVIITNLQIEKVARIDTETVDREQEPADTQWTEKASG